MGRTWGDAPKVRPPDPKPKPKDDDKKDDKK